jgi:acetyltransferase-like isoleucine patch superfamily enzyme
MAYLSQVALSELGFKRLGKNVKISSKASIYNPEQMEFGDFARVDDFCLLSGKVTIGRNVHIAAFCNVAGGEAGITFEDFSGLAYGCHVFSQVDDYSGHALTNPTVPDKYTFVSHSPVIIRRHALLGTNSVIFPGVVLEEGTSVGAMSLVNKSTEPWSIYIGIPARRLKARKRDLLELEKAFLSESEL